MTRIDYPGNIFENFHYLADGSLASDTLTNSSTSAHKYADALLRSTTFAYDAQQKLLSALNQSGPQDHHWTRYSGVGHLVHSADSSYNMIIGGGRQAWTLTEGMRYDALGNQTADTRIATNIAWPDSTTFSESGTAYHYATTGTARLTRDVGSADDSLLYNAAGANEFQYSTFSADGFRHDRASFYAADNTLRAVDNRSAHVAGHLIDGGIISTFEEYRYDALGRRILTRSHHYCDADLSDGVMCLVSFIRRTVWDGSQELAEMQMPAGDSATTTPVAVAQGADGARQRVLRCARARQSGAFGVRRSGDAQRVGSRGDQAAAHTFPLARYRDALETARSKTTEQSIKVAFAFTA